MTTNKYEIFPEIFHDTGEIHLNSSLAGEKIKTEVMKTKDAATRSALIALGWTPPDQPRSLPDDMGYKSLAKDGPVGSALMWLDAALKCASFHWDWDQKEYAEDALASAREWIRKLGPVPSQASQPEVSETARVVCAHDVTVPEVFQDPGDRVSRACWTLTSKCKKCGTVFVFDTQFGFFSDLYREIR